MNNIPKYSVVVPVFNSEQSLEELFLGIEAVFKKLKQSFQVVFVEDHGSDDSWEVLKKLKSAYGELITAIRLSKNFGQHNTTLCGFGFAKGDFIITIDDDLQTLPSEIPKLIQAEETEHADLVYGYFPRKSHSRVRNIGSSSLKKSSKVLHNAPGEGSSFRLVRKDLMEKILEHQQHFIYLDEILHWYTDDIAFVQVEHHPRKYNRSGYSVRKLVKLLGNILIQYTTLPLKFLVYGGLIGSLITFALVVYYLVLKFRFDVPLGYTSLIISILFSTSIILFSLGIIGEYLRRIYLVQNKKPPYSIKKVL